MRLAVELTFAGASAAPTDAQNEAIERARLAVERVGGVLNLIGVNAQVVTWAGQAPAVGVATVLDYAQAPPLTHSEP